MAYEAILCAVDGPVMTITLNRPDKLNAYTNQMGQEIAAALRQADGDDAGRAVILTGAGRGFCAGADMSAGATSFDTKSGPPISAQASDRRTATGPGSSARCSIARR